ncbi:MAG: hypothetical protein JNM55_23265 [Anaerolineales bacterium]|nr:hypothetical protein [Anaerolineales bacterium]
MTEATWGIRFNEYPNYQRFHKSNKPEGCPEWLESRHFHNWQDQGLIIWNNINRNIETLNGTESLKLLSELVSQEAWKSDGVSVTRLVHRFEINLPSGKKRKKGELESDIEKPKGEDVYEEILHLPPEAGYELIELLEAKKQSITQMAEQEEKRIQEAWRQVWDLLFELSHEKEMKEFDFKARSFEWQSDGVSRMICRYQTAEGGVWLAKDKLFWNTCVKREGHVGNSHYFVKFVDATDWVEKEIVNLANEPDVKNDGRILSEEEIKANHIRLKTKLINGPYWIDAARMEPQRITYKVLIDLDAKPISYKSFETICGDTYKFADRYPTPGKLANDIHLDIGHFQIDQMLGENSEYFRFTSLTNYFQEASVAEQAQKVWNQSRILQQFKTGEIVRGRFGYQEVETEYITLLGVCGPADHVWQEEKNRSEFMERKALRESLSFALDVNDYRDFLGLSAELINDERLVESMHETRSDSKFIPDEARRESRVWLAQNKPLD